MNPEDGSTMVLMAALIGLMATVAIAVAGLGLAYSARSQAQTASDSAALAAAVATYPAAARGSPAGTAHRIANMNGARLVSCSCVVDASMRPRVVTVVAAVSVDAPIFGVLEVRAVSRAEFDPRRWLGR